MSQGPRHGYRKGVLLFLLLFTEVWSLSRFFPDVRIFVFDSLNGFRGIKVLISLAGLMAIFALTSKTRTVIELDGSARKFLPLHLACFATLFWLIDPLWHFSLSGNPAAALLAWILTSLAFAGSWLLCLCRPLSLTSFMRERGAVILWLTFLLTPLINLAESLWRGSFVYTTLLFCSKILEVFFPGTVMNPETLVLGVPGFTVIVGHLCSGYEGMALIFGLLSIYLWLKRGDLCFPAALYILPIGVLASWIANIARIVILVALGARINPDLALGAFHSQAGWVSFVFLAIAIVAVVEKFGLFQKSQESNADFPAAAYLAPLTCQLALILAFSAFTTHLDFFYPLRILIVCAILCLHKQKLIANGWWRLPKPTAATAFLGILVYFAWVWLTPTRQVEHLALPGSLAAVWLVFRLFGSVIVVPFVEELAFRGYLLRRLQSRSFEEVPFGHLTVFSAGASSLLFGLMHNSVAAGFLAGLAFAYCTTLRNQFGDAVAAHSVANLCVAAHVVIGHRWDLWL